MNQQASESLEEAIRGAHPTPSRAAGRPGSLLAAVVFCGLIVFPGCALPQPSAHLLTPTYRPRNVFAWGSSLPPEVRRVAVLPMACDPNDADMAYGRDALEPIMRVELAKLRRFELISVNPDSLKARTGHSTWGCEEALPNDLFTWLGESHGCDAVLFCRLTTFRGYAPLAVGWRMRLIDIRTHATLWAGDEVFDARQPAVLAVSWHAQLAGLLTGGRNMDEWEIKNSPRQFGQCAAAQLLATLPGR